MALKKVLIICYYWPPAGGPGVQRWFHFAKNLPLFGYQPTVYTPKNPNYAMVDQSLVSQVPSTIKVIKQPIKEPYKWVSWLFKSQTKRMSQGLLNEKNPSFIEILLRAIRGNFFVPDARVSFVKPSIAFLEEYLKTHQINTIITTGPPHSMHLIGRELKIKNPALRWISDFRDPWTTIGYHKSLYLGKRAKKKHKALEASVLGLADIITTTSNTTAQDFKSITKRPIKIITNGFEAKDWKETPCTKLVAKQLQGFSMLHIGSLLSGRNPEVLWASIASILKASPAFEALFSLHFVGIVSEQVKTRLHLHGLMPYCTFHGYRPHKEMAAYQKYGQLLLLLEINSKDHRGIIPGKLFEYMASETPILGIGPLDWEVSEIVAHTQSGAVFLYEDKTAIKTFILQAFEQFKKGNAAQKPKNIAAYERKTLTQSLVHILDQWE